MRSFNPFMQKQHKNAEVILKQCTVCHGNGVIHEDGEEMICSNCDGSGEIAEKKIIKSINPKN